MVDDFEVIIKFELIGSDRISVFGSQSCTPNFVFPQIKWHLIFMSLSEAVIIPSGPLLFPVALDSIVVLEFKYVGSTNQCFGGSTI